MADTQSVEKSDPTPTGHQDGGQETGPDTGLSIGQGTGPDESGRSDAGRSEAEQSALVGPGASAAELAPVDQMRGTLGRERETNHVLAEAVAIRNDALEMAEGIVEHAERAASALEDKARRDGEVALAEARVEADRLVTAARREAASIRHEATGEAERIRSEATEQVATAQQEAEQVLAAAREQAAAITAEAGTEAERTLAAATEQRATAERELEAVVQEHDRIRAEVEAYRREQIITAHAEAEAVLTDLGELVANLRGSLASSMDDVRGAAKTLEILQEARAASAQLAVESPGVPRAQEGTTDDEPASEGVGQEQSGPAKSDPGILILEQPGSPDARTASQTATAAEGDEETPSLIEALLSEDDGQDAPTPVWTAAQATGGQQNGNRRFRRKRR